MSSSEDPNQKLGEILDRQVVDDDARAALRRARNAALDAGARPHSRRPRWFPAAAVAALLLLGIGVALLYPGLNQPPMPAASFDDMVVIDSEDELELLEELEFYVWLEQQEQG